MAAKICFANIDFMKYRIQHESWANAFCQKNIFMIEQTWSFSLNHQSPLSLKDAVYCYLKGRKNFGTWYLGVIFWRKQVEHNGRNLSTYSLLEAIKKQASFHRVFVGKKCKCNFWVYFFCLFKETICLFFKIISKPREFEFNYNFWVYHLEKVSWAAWV